jgi:hypothetical protein
LDRGKGSAELDPVLAEAVAKVVNKVIKEFAAVKSKLDREQHRAARLARERLTRGRMQETTVREAASSRPTPAKSCTRLGSTF